MRATSSAISGQAHNPISSGPTFSPKLNRTPAKRNASDAITCAKTPPPNSNTSRHVTYTPAAAQSAGTRRSKKSECPPSCVNAANNGTTGG